MKKIILIIVLFCSISSQAQKLEATLFFKDGTSLNGLAKITEFGDKVRFRKAKGEKKTVYTSEGLEYIKIKKKVNVHLGNLRGDIKHVTYYYKSIKNLGSPRLLELIVKGKVTLYRKHKEGHNHPTFSGGGVNGPGMMMGGGSYSISDYYVIKKNEKTVTHLGTKGSLFSKNFKKAASEYFKDCSELVEKIKKKEFRKRDLEKVVKFYNYNCN